MRWDIGPQGVLVLVAMAVGFGLVAVLVLGRRAARWAPIAAAAAFVVVGLVISEVWFGWATEEELQPNIDGLSFDEVLIGALLGVVVLVVVRVLLARRARSDRSRPGRHR